MFFLVAEGQRVAHFQDFGQVYLAVGAQREALKIGADDDAVLLEIARAYRVARLFAAAGGRKRVVLNLGLVENLVQKVGGGQGRDFGGRVKTGIEFPLVVRKLRVEIIAGLVVEGGVLLRVEQAHLMPHALRAHVGVDVDVGGAGFATLRGNQHHAVGGAQAVDGRG